jgi:hypothetical protein
MDNLLDPLVTVLLQERARNDQDQKSRFFSALGALAQKHGVDRKEYCLERFAAPDEGYAVRVGSGAELRVVVILRGDDHVIPGSDTQYLLLLDREGRLVDRLACAVSNRLTRFIVGHMADFRTEVLDVPADDGAQLVIRFIPEDGGSVSGNWSHDVIHAGRTTTWCWDQDRPDAIRSAEWDRNGLCRVAVQKNGFTVLFPKLEQ